MDTGYCKSPNCEVLGRNGCATLNADNQGNACVPGGDFMEREGLKMQAIR